MNKTQNHIKHIRLVRNDFMSQELLKKPVEFFFSSFDREMIYTRYWPVDKEFVKGAILILHGLGETADYYDEFSRTANIEGFAVYISEARGHGRTAGDINSPYYGNKAGDIGREGFTCLYEDARMLTRLIRSEYRNKPVFMLGHSMGSLTARLYSARYGELIDGLILTGALAAPDNIDELKEAIENEISLNGLKAPCRYTFSLFFKDVSKQFEPVKTELDWITSDARMIDESLKLPYTYIMFNNGFYRSLFEALDEAGNAVLTGRFPRKLPVYLLSGGKDSITGNGRITQEQYKAYKKAGITDIEIKIYENCRHSILREVNRSEISHEILDWCKARLK